MNFWEALAAAAAAIGSVAVFFKLRYSDKIKGVCQGRYRDIDGDIAYLKTVVEELRRDTNEFKIFKARIEARLEMIEKNTGEISATLLKLDDHMTALRICAAKQEDRSKVKHG